MKKLIFVLFVFVTFSLKCMGQSIMPSEPRPATLGRAMQFPGPSVIVPGQSLPDVKLPSQYTPNISPVDVYLQDRNSLQNR